MKKLLTLSIIALLAACAPVAQHPDITVSGYEGDAISLSGKRQTVTLQVSLSSKGNEWEASTPTSTPWLTCYPGADGGLVVSVAENPGDLSRESYVLIVSEETKMRVKVVQDYLKILAFASETASIDAARDTYSVPFTTNLLPEEYTVSVSGADWITDLEIKDGEVFFTAGENPSETAARTAVLTLVGGGEESSVEVSQVPMSGHPYLIDLTSLRLGEYPVYEIIDTEHGGEKVAEVCKEYIYKYDSGKDETIVEGSFTVVYPMKDGEVDYAKGLVVDNGGSVSWGVSVDEESGARRVAIASYKAGSATGVKRVVKPRGATSFRVGELAEGVEPAQIECREMKVVDERSGAANTQGGTSESYTYTVVKLGLQYWQRENLKTTRYNDGTPIPTGFDKAGWAARADKTLQPGCMVRTKSTSYDDANASAAASTRNTYGCVYNYAAIVRQSIDISGSSASSFPKVDNISPEGWTVPTRGDYDELIAYVQQKTYASTTAMTADLLPKLMSTSGAGNNLTGFNGLGDSQRGRTGGYNNDLCYYGTLDYTYADSAHRFYVFRLRSGNYSLTYADYAAAANYVRLLKK